MSRTVKPCRRNRRAAEHLGRGGEFQKEFAAEEWNRPNERSAAIRFWEKASPNLYFACSLQAEWKLPWYCVISEHSPCPCRKGAWKPGWCTRGAAPVTVAGVP